MHIATEDVSNLHPQSNLVRPAVWLVGTGIVLLLVRRANFEQVDVAAFFDLEFVSGHLLSPCVVDPAAGYVSTSVLIRLILAA